MLHSKPLRNVFIQSNVIFIAYYHFTELKVREPLGINILFTPSQFLFDLTPEGMYTRDQEHLIHILLMTARKMVTIKWLNPQPPTVAQWKQKIREVYGMEALTAQLQLRSDVFVRRWLPITGYLKECLCFSSIKF